MLSFVKTNFKVLITVSAIIWMMLVTAELTGSQVSQVGIITVDRLNVRKGPGKDEPIIRVLTKRTEVLILAHHNGWLKIWYKGSTGYIRNREKYITLGKKNTEDNLSGIEQAQAEAKDIHRKIEIHKAELQKFKIEESTVISRLNKIERALNKSWRRVNALKKERESVEKEIGKTETSINKIKKKIRENERYTSERLVAHFKLSLTGRVQVLASAESMHELLIRKKALEHILNYDEKILNEHTENKTRLIELLERQKARKKDKIKVENDLKYQIRMMSVEKTKRSKLLGEIRSRKSLQLASIDSLKQAAIALDETILKLRPEPIPTSSKGLKKFTLYKGLLKIPVKGTIMSRFGSYKDSRLKVVNFRSGIEIKADMGEPIRTVCSGQVIYSSWFKGYGNMIIIDHGDNYYTVYAHAQEIFKRKGDMVEINEVIATVGDTASMRGSVLYFEIRHHGKPVDPLKWLQSG